MTTRCSLQWEETFAWKEHRKYISSLSSVYLGGGNDFAWKSPGKATLVEISQPGSEERGAFILKDILMSFHSITQSWCERFKQLVALHCAWLDLGNSGCLLLSAPGIISLQSLTKGNSTKKRLSAVLSLCKGCSSHPSSVQLHNENNNLQTNEQIFPPVFETVQDGAQIS